MQLLDDIHGDNHEGKYELHHNILAYDYCAACDLTLDKMENEEMMDGLR